MDHLKSNPNTICENCIVVITTTITIFPHKIDPFLTEKYREQKKDSRILKRTLTIHPWNGTVLLQSIRQDSRELLIYHASKESRGNTRIQFCLHAKVERN